MSKRVTRSSPDNSGLTTSPKSGPSFEEWRELLVRLSSISPNGPEPQFRILVKHLRILKKHSANIAPPTITILKHLWGKISTEGDSLMNVANTLFTAITRFSEQQTILRYSNSSVCKRPGNHTSRMGYVENQGNTDDVNDAEEGVCVAPQPACRGTLPLTGDEGTRKLSLRRRHPSEGIPSVVAATAKWGNESIVQAPISPVSRRDATSAQSIRSRVDRTEVPCGSSRSHSERSILTAAATSRSRTSSEDAASSISSKTSEPISSDGSRKRALEASPLRSTVVTASKSPHEEPKESVSDPSLPFRNVAFPHGMHGLNMRYQSSRSLLRFKSYVESTTPTSIMPFPTRSKPSLRG